MCGSLNVLRWLVLVSASCQLVGTALVVWGLRITTQNPKDTLTLVPEGGHPRPQAAIVSEHPRAFTMGVVLLLAGLALQVVVALL